ncbi:GNAT family N-acetyltransferase [Sporosarcina sp. CAU 1771]
MLITVERVKDLNAIDISHLVKESESEGYRFVTRLVTDFQDGSNTFNKQGEALFLIRDKDNDVVAIGGVNESPFAVDENVGRLQRFYVLSEARRKGVGSQLLKEIIQHSKAVFDEMTVRTESSKADAFYRANGFVADDSSSETTHVIKFKK